MTKGDYLYDKTGSDPEIEALERLLARFAHDAPLRPVAKRRRMWIASAAVGTALAAAATWLIWAPSVRPPGCEAGEPGFRFQSDGRALCGGRAQVSGVLPVGRWLETASGTQSQVELADIGELTIHGASRLRLLNTGPEQHRLELRQGKVSAQVLAPPRLFIIDTPSVAAVDLGCAYDLEVDAAGRTHLVVESGAVSLERARASGTESRTETVYVPMGYEVTATPGRGPGTPVSRLAGPLLRDAGQRFDAGEPGALAVVLAHATPGDAMTLWNLLARTEGTSRQQVILRLDALCPHPDDVDLADVLAGRVDALEAWRRHIDDWLPFGAGSCRGA